MHMCTHAYTPTPTWVCLCFFFFKQKIGTTMPVFEEDFIECFSTSVYPPVFFKLPLGAGPWVKMKNWIRQPRIF